MTARADETSYDLATATGTIFGTLLRPATPRRPPVALVIAGSGPTDRNGNSPALQLNTYQKLAAALAARNIATLRYDKRGIAASHAAAPAEADLRFDTYVDDAVRWIEKLRADDELGAVTVIGHSEGSLIGMIAAQRVHAECFISLEGAGFPAADLLRAQLAPQLRPYPQLARQAEAIIVALQGGTTVPAAGVPAELAALFRPSVQPYLISWFAYDPRAELRTVRARVTIVQGTHDVQTPVENGRALATACPAGTFVVIEQMTHVLADDPGATVAQQMATVYADAGRPLNAMLVETLVRAVNRPA